MLLTFRLDRMTAYTAHRWMDSPNNGDSDGVLETAVLLIQDIGIVGLSSTVLSIMVVAIIAGVKAAMVLLNWHKG